MLPNEVNPASNKERRLIETTRKSATAVGCMVAKWLFGLMAKAP
jgi:hypothetical protein